jgi:hypothetical protein
MTARTGDGDRIATLGTGHVELATARFGARSPARGSGICPKGQTMISTAPAPAAVRFDEPADDGDLMVARAGRTRFLNVPERRYP